MKGGGEGEEEEGEEEEGGRTHSVPVECGCV